MSAAALSLPRVRRAGTAVLAAGLVLAVGLSALAEDVAPVLRTSAPVTPLAAPLPAAGDGLQPPGDDGGPGARAPASSRAQAPLATAAAPAPATQADPPPFAPGGDDILGTEPPAPDAGQASPAGALAPAPGLQLWLDSSLSADGIRQRLNIASSAATRCQGTGALQGLLPTNGRLAVPTLPPGRHLLGVACRSGGAVQARSLTVAVPLPVLAGSVANRLAYGLGGWSGHGPATAADFLQQGREAVWAAGPAGTVQLLVADEAGPWIDRVAELLPLPAERRACGQPLQALTADLNLDGLPDVLLVCADASPLLFLSQAGGPYRRVDTGLPVPAGPVELLDADGDGAVDIVPAEAPASVLWRGLGEGRFSAGTR